MSKSVGYLGQTVILYEKLVVLLQHNIPFALDFLNSGDMAICRNEPKAAGVLIQVKKEL